MQFPFRGGLVLALSLVLAACSLPRGAGLQSEVLAAQTDAETGADISDFSVFAVTRETVGFLND